MRRLWIVFLLISCKVTTGCVTRIVGGVPATKGEFPWLVSIQVPDAEPPHVCGGSILNSTSIVTAAHCLAPFSVDAFALHVVAGAHNIKEEEDSQVVRRVKSISIHPGFESTKDRVRHDLAILEVDQEFDMTEFIQPISLPPSDDHISSGYCWIAGWGFTNSTSYTSDILLKALIPIVPKEDCKNIYGDRLDEYAQICAGFENGGVDACYGDTGIPLVCDDLGYYYIAGIMSWGLKCAQANSPGVYTEMSAYVKQENEDDKHYIDY